MNALVHGAYAETTVLPVEHQEEFNQRRQSMLDQHQPVGDEECILIEEMVANLWRLERARIASTSLTLNNYKEAKKRAHLYDADPTNAFEILGIAFDRRANAQVSVGRVEGRYRTAYYRARAELKLLQAERKRDEQSTKPKNTPSTDSIETS